MPHPKSRHVSHTPARYPARVSGEGTAGSALGRHEEGAWHGRAGLLTEERRRV